MHNKCDICKFKRNIPGDTHISCVNPDPRIKLSYCKRWFMYPINFDPVWMPFDCNNFQEQGK